MITATFRAVRVRISWNKFSDAGVILCAVPLMWQAFLSTKVAQGVLLLDNGSLAIVVDNIPEPPLTESGPLVLGATR